MSLASSIAPSKSFIFSTGKRPSHNYQNLEMHWFCVTTQLQDSPKHSNPSSTPFPTAAGTSPVWESRGCSVGCALVLLSLLSTECSSQQYEGGTEFLPSDSSLALKMFFPTSQRRVPSRESWGNCVWLSCSAFFIHIKGVRVLGLNRFPLISIITVVCSLTTVILL